MFPGFDLSLHKLGYFDLGAGCMLPTLDKTRK